MLTIAQLKRLKKKNRGASLVEYALLLALIAVVCIAAVRAIGERASTQFSRIAEELGPEEKNSFNWVIREGDEVLPRVPHHQTNHLFYMATQT